MDWCIILLTKNQDVNGNVFEKLCMNTDLEDRGATLHTGARHIPPPMNYNCNPSPNVLLEGEILLECLLTGESFVEILGLLPSVSSF